MNEKEEADRGIIIKLPYMGRCSTIFAKTFSLLIQDTFDVKIDAVYTSLKLQSFFPLKSSTPNPFLSNVVYKYVCVSDPKLFYIGQTSRHLLERAKEHLTLSDKNSAVSQHISQCRACQNTDLSVANFEVLKKCRNQHDVRIYEALLIQKLHPTLNTQVSSDYGFLLKVFR